MTSAHLSVACAASSAPASPHRAAPWIFMVLIIPFGLISGFLTVALAYEMNQAGVSATAIAGLIALSFLPNSWKFLWAPLVDLSWTRRRWYLASTLLTALGLIGMAWYGAGGRDLAGLSVAMLVCVVSGTLSAMSVDSLMAHSTADEAKGRAAGWFQAGNIGGGALGGGLALWLVQSWGVSVLMSGVVLAVVCLFCCLPLLILPEPPPEPRAAGWSERTPMSKCVQVFKDLWADLWSLVRSRAGVLALLVCFLPIGTGAASNLWSVLAGDWHAGANTVALVNGGLGGVASALGCLLGGFLCDRIDRKLAYCLFGLAQVVLAVAMALAPHTETNFVILASSYLFAVGLSYAGFSAVVLEVIGRGAAATKYNLLASLSNMPIGYMTWVNGQSYERWGAANMLHLEAGISLLAVGLFALASRAGQSRPK